MTLASLARIAAAALASMAAGFIPRVSVCVGVTMLVLTFAARPVWAAPNEGEARSILRDPERVYEVVAGEGDAASTVVNPANLGYLGGVNGIFDLAWSSTAAARRDTGLGLFIAAPLPFRIAALGFGYQYFYPVQRDAGGSGVAEPQNPDDPYNKFTFALAVPLKRWVPGLALGMNVSRLWSRTNFHASGVHQVDLAASYWPVRFVAFASVFRAINIPRTGPDRTLVQPFVIEPAVALRPFGTKIVELAASLRLAPIVPQEQARFNIQHVTPRGRLFIAADGVRFFAEVERYKHFPIVPGDALVNLDARDAVKVSAGFELNLPHLGVATAVLASAGGASRFAADGGAVRVRVSQERYPSVRLAPRRVSRFALKNWSGEAGMWEVVQALDDLAEHRALVLVEPRGMSFGWAQVEEIRQALLRVRKRGGTVIAYLDGGTLRHYFLASAADRIFAHPHRSLEIVGMRIEAFYYEQLLAKLGARAEFVRIGDYKATPEHYERMSATPPVARFRRQLLADVWNHVLRRIAQERGHDAGVVKHWIDQAPIEPSNARERGIIDELAFPDELDARVEAWLRRKVRIADPSEQPRHRTAFAELPHVAVLVVEGDLTRSQSFTVPVLGRRVAGSTTLTETIETLRKDRSVRAVVVRLDTPGGLTSAAQDIARELDLTRKVKPVVISMGNTCASAGYYIATAGQYIYADATTTTGSIGIFYPKMDLSGTLDKLGIGVDRLEFGEHAALRSWWKPYTREARITAYNDIWRDYEVFLRRVAQARNMELAKADSLARGRIWSGVRAVDVGLVDAYGGLREAIFRARAIAGMDPEEGEVVLYPAQPGALRNLRRLFGFEIPWPFGHARGRGVFAEVATRISRLPAPFLQVLKSLPLGLWWEAKADTMALADPLLVIAD